MEIQNEKFKRIKNHYMHIYSNNYIKLHIFNQFLNLFLMKVNVKNICSSSTFSRTTMTINSRSIKYLDNMCYKTWLIYKCFHIRVGGLQSRGAWMARVQSNCIVITNTKVYWSNKSTSNKGSCETPINNVVLLYTIVLLFFQDS